MHTFVAAIADLVKSEPLTLGPTVNDQEAAKDSPIGGDHTFYTYCVPGSVFLAKDGTTWHLETVNDFGMCRIRNAWYPREEATVPIADVRRAIDSWIVPVQQRVDPLPEDGGIEMEREKAAKKASLSLSEIVANQTSGSVTGSKKRASSEDNFYDTDIKVNVVGLGEVGLWGRLWYDTPAECGCSFSLDLSAYMDEDAGYETFIQIQTKGTAKSTVVSKRRWPGGVRDMGWDDIADYLNMDALLERVPKSIPLETVIAWAKEEGHDLQNAIKKPLNFEASLSHLIAAVADVKTADIFPFEAKLVNVDEGDWESEDLHESLKSYEGQMVTVTAEATDGYYDIETSDGQEFGAISAFHLLSDRIADPTMDQSLEAPRHMRPFTKEDWYGFGGADSFPDGSEPMIGVVKCTNWPVEEDSETSDAVIIASGDGADGSTVQVLGTGGGFFAKDFTGETQTLAKSMAVQFADNIASKPSIGVGDLLHMGMEAVNFDEEAEAAINQTRGQVTRREIGDELGHKGASADRCNCEFDKCNHEAGSCQEASTENVELFGAQTKLCKACLTAAKTAGAVVKEAATKAASTVTLDVDYNIFKDPTYNPEFLEFLQSSGITYEIVNEDGPAGGNPEVKFTAPREVLEKMIEEFFDPGSEEEVAMYKGEIKEAAVKAASTVTLDVYYVVFDEPEDETSVEFHEYMKAHNIAFEVVNENGPAGGNPEVKFTAPREVLVQMIKDLFDAGGGQDDIDYQVGFIKDME